MGQRIESFASKGCPPRWKRFPFFLGFGESEDRGPKGYLAIIKKACELLLWNQIFSRTSSLVTDGENMNTGTKNGLWALCNEERSQLNSGLPLLKIGVLAIE